MVTFREIGNWRAGQIVVTSVPSTRAICPEVERSIEQAWANATARLGAKLFDGPMCRLERCAASRDQLRLWVSPTSYKPFFGTNLAGANVPPEAMANPLGLSAALVTRDGWLMLGQRNAGVAYYPSRVHPFAGSLEPADAANVFAGVRRELAEELHFGDGDLADLRCLGIVEDSRLKQPEIIFSVQSTRMRREIESMLDASEHHACVAMEAASDRVERMMEDARLTPVAVGTLALWGRVAFGDEWFSSLRPGIEGP